MIVDLGCGKNKHPGAIGVDNVKLDAVDVVHDLLEFPYPFEEASVDGIVISHVLEHFSLEDIAKILNEAGRILAKGGKIIISLPHVFSVGAWDDLGHKTHFTYESMYFFTRKHEANYRKDFKLQHEWSITRLWTSVNVVNDHFVSPSCFSRFLSRCATKIFNMVLKMDKGMTFSEVLVKISPVWLVNIHLHMQKTEGKK